MEREKNENLQIKNTVKIRNEVETDYKTVEDMTRKAFWNLYVPGCDEHYLVHVMRTHEDFVPELDFVIERDNQVIGNIMYTKAKLIDESGQEKDILTFGPVCIMPKHQRKGYGKLFIEFLWNYYKECKTLYVGTGDSLLTIPFYKSCGFLESHRVKDFFAINYERPIWDGDVQLKDMVYLKRTRK